MMRLKEIVEKIVEHFQLIVIEEYDTQLLIHRAEILSAQTVFEEHVLYLCDTALPVLPPATMHCWLITAEANVAPFCPLRITRPVPAAALYCQINQLLGLTSLIESQSNQLYHALYRGKGLKSVVTLAEEFFGYPISICDASYNMIETSPLMEHMEYGLSHSSSRVYLADDEVESLKRNQVVEQIYRSPHAFGVRTVDHPDNQWIFCAIRIQNVMTGYVAVCMGDTDATEYILRMTTILADVCAIEMQKHDFFITRTGMKYENFLIDLLEGHFSDVNLISSRLELLDRRFCRFFCLIVLSCMEPHDSDLFNKQQMTALRAAYPNSMSVVYQDAIVLFLNQNEPIRLSEDFTAKLLSFSRLNHMKAGISQPFADILKIRAYYLQAVNTLTLGEDANPEEILHFAADLLPQYLFQQADPTGLSVGIHHHIYHLTGYDQEYHTEFIPTLRAYLANDRNATKAAAALHIHRSTFFYRIKKIEELLDISLTDSHLLFLYELSFLIWDYLC